MSTEKCCLSPGGAATAARCGAKPPAQSEAPCCPSAEVLEVLDHLEEIGYDRDEVAQFPAAVLLATAGSGNPVGFAELKECETVVDLGCGGGLDCFLAAKRVGPCGKVIGLDRMPQAVAAANENKCKLGVENVEFRDGDLENMPLADASVDVAISNCVGPVTRAEPGVLRDAARVLKPGGRLVTTGTMLDDDTPEEAIREMAASNPSGFVPARESDYVAKFRAAGFATVEFVHKQPTLPHRWKLMVVARKAACC